MSAGGWGLAIDADFQAGRDLEGLHLDRELDVCRRVEGIRGDLGEAGRGQAGSY